MKLKFPILLLFLLLSNLLFADDVKFTVSASKTQVGTGEQFELTYTINTNASRFSPPDLRDFRILSGPNQSSSMTWINGVSSASTTFSYDLMAVQAGEYTIGPAYINAEGSRHTTVNILKIKVVQGKSVPPNNQPAQQNDIDQQKNGEGTNISSQLMIRASVDKTNVYIGEQITVNYRLYTQVSLVGNSLDKLPDLNGFWSQDIKKTGDDVTWKTEMYNGEKYNVADLKQTILFPERSGKLIIDPLSMTFTVRQAEATNNLIDQFFGAFEDVNYKIKSTPVTIHVKPLPETGKPDGFSGAVGTFNINAAVDKQELKANEALNYKLKISGSGNINLLNAPKIDFPAGLEKYDPQLKDSISETQNGVSGSREYNYLLIPRHSGGFMLSPVKFSYFDPVTEKYVSLTTRSFQVKVNKGNPEENTSALFPGDQQGIKTLNNDIRYIKTDFPNRLRVNGTFYGSSLYYFLLATGPLVFLLAFAYRKWHTNHNIDQVKVKSRKANKLAAKHLANAQKQLQAGNNQAFYEAIFKGIYGYLSDKLNIPVSGLNKETIARHLRMQLLDEPVIQQLLETLDLCEMARFAPVSDFEEQAVFEKAKNIINDIEIKL